MTDVHHFGGAERHRVRQLAALDAGGDEAHAFQVQQSDGLHLNSLVEREIEVACPADESERLVTVLRERERHA